MNAITTKTSDALNQVYGPSAANFALTVLSRQISFCFESKGFTTVIDKSDTNGGPTGDGDTPVFDETLSLANPLMDGLERKSRKFNMDAASTAYAACLILAADALQRPLEYGRKPTPESLARYFSQPTDWLMRKIAYWQPRITKQEQDKGSVFGASKESIEQRVAAQVAAYKATAETIARTMAASIKVASRKLQNEDREELIIQLMDAVKDLGINADDEVKNAGEALLRIRKEQFERGEKVSSPQPGMLKLFADLGVALK